MHDARVTGFTTVPTTLLLPPFDGLHSPPVRLRQRVVRIFPECATQQRSSVAEHRNYFRPSLHSKAIFSSPRYVPFVRKTF